MATCTRILIGPYLSPCTKHSFQWIKDLNIKPDTLDVKEEKVGNNVELIGTGEDFMNKIP